MIVTTTEHIPSYDYEILGIVRGNTVRAKHVGKGILAGLKNIVGGEIQEYIEMLEEARKEAMNCMINRAEELGADAIVNVRFTTSYITQGAAEILDYGTAVKLKEP